MGAFFVRISKQYGTCYFRYLNSININLFADSAHSYSQNDGTGKRDKTEEFCQKMGRKNI
jgi:hypothetical protein